MRKYEVRVNLCTCHPETCCCNPWAVHRPDGSKHSTFFDHNTADEVANALSRATHEAEALGDKEAAKQKGEK